MPTPTTSNTTTATAAATATIASVCTTTAAAPNSRPPGIGPSPAGTRWALPGRRRLAVPDLVQSVFPNLTYLTVTRRDKVRQAVSLWRAQNADRAAGDRLTYSHAAIAHLIRDIEDHEFGWRAFFRECGVEPFEVVYEDFAASYEDALREILRHVGIPEADTVAIATPTRRRQADDLSQRWTERYKAESGRLAHA